MSEEGGFLCLQEFKKSIRLITFENPHSRCSLPELAVVSLPHVPNPAPVRAAAMAAVGDVCRIQSGVRYGVPASGVVELAGRIVLDDPAARDRSEAGT